MLSISTQLVIIHGTSKTPMRNYVSENEYKNIMRCTFLLWQDMLITYGFINSFGILCWRTIFTESTRMETLNRSDNKWHLVTYYSSLSSSVVLLERFNFYLEGIDFITQKDVTVFINTQFIGKQCQFVSWGCLEVLEFRSLLYILIKYTNSIAHRPHNFAFLFRVIDYMII